MNVLKILFNSMGKVRRCYNQFKEVKKHKFPWSKEMVKRLSFPTKVADGNGHLAPFPKLCSPLHPGLPPHPWQCPRGSGLTVPSLGTGAQPSLDAAFSPTATLLPLVVGLPKCLFPALYPQCTPRRSVGIG